MAAEKTLNAQKGLAWLLQWTPRIVVVAFSLMLVFVLVAVVVSGLVLGGTVTVSAKAIGLTQSLVLFAAVFSVAYICLHLYAARKARHKLHSQQKDPKSLARSRCVLFLRTTLGLWATALIAVGATLGSNRSLPASALGALRADMAACIANGLCMAAVDAIVETTPQPFILPWITPVVPCEEQSSAAKTLVQDILEDGVSGQSAPNSSSSSVQEKQAPQAPPPEHRDEAASPHPPSPHPPSFKTEHSNHQSTPEERQRLWSPVQEGGTYSPPAPPPARTSLKPQRAEYLSYPGPAAHERTVITEVARSKHLFNRAVEGLRVTDRSRMRIPGTFVEDG